MNEFGIETIIILDRSFSMGENFKFLLKVNVYLFEALKLNECTTFECWIATIPKNGFIIQTTVLLFERFGVHLKCFHCSSPGFLEVEKRLQWNSTKDQLTYGGNIFPILNFIT